MTLPIEGSMNYLAILVLAIAGIFITTAVLIVNKILGKKGAIHTKKKFEVYESGVNPMGDAHQQFSVRYYLIGIIFLVFDVEVVFMYPWSLVYKSYLSEGPLILIEMAVFFFLLFGGYIYLRLRGALNWD